jgi:hypothetical protein
MKIDYDKLHDNIHNEGDLRASFEDFISSLTAVRYSLKRNVHGEYEQPAVFHMWTGWCMKAV